MGDIMKRIFLTVLSVVSITTLAHAEISVSGIKAKKIALALEAAGAFFDSGMGKVGTEASEVKCLVTGNSVNQKSYSCTLSVQSETGDMKPVSLEGKSAKNLFRALATAGADGDCGMGKCSAEAQSVNVEYQNSKNPPEESYSASIN